MRKVTASLYIVPLLSVLSWSLASPALAAGLPQLDISTFPSQLIWLALTFVVLYFAMSRIALPKVGQVLEERQQRIEDNLEKAETLRREADAAAKAYESSLAEARAEAHGVMIEIGNRIAEQAAKQLAELGEKLSQETAAAEQRIGEARDKAMQSLGEVAGEVAQAAAEKLAGETLEGKEVAATVASIIEAGPMERNR